jgi:hypothetical protein
MSDIHASTQSEETIDWSFLSRLNTRTKTATSLAKPRRQHSKTTKTKAKNMHKPGSAKVIEAPTSHQPPRHQHKQKQTRSNHTSLTSIKTSGRMMEIRMMLKNIKRQQARLEARLAKVRLNCIGVTLLLQHISEEDLHPSDAETTRIRVKTAKSHHH